MENIESVVTEALASEPNWPGESVSDGREDARRAAISSFESAAGLQLPGEYKYLAVHHPGTMTRMRLFTDVDLPTKVEIDPFAPSLRHIEKLMQRRAERWQTGEFAIDLLGDVPPPPVIQWAPFLLPLFSSGDHLAWYDFRFDRNDPPIILIQTGSQWSSSAPRAKAVYVADSLLAYFGLEVLTDENWDETPADLPTQGQSEWTEWRDTQLIPECG